MEHVLDRPPPLHSKLTDFGERPYWSPDGKRIAFVESNFGDVAEIDLATRRVRNLTRSLGDHHSFLRVLFLSNGDYLLIGPAEFKEQKVSRHVESELWVMDRDAKRPPVPLGRRMYEGAGVSTIAPRIAYAVSGRNDPGIGAPDRYECHVTEIDYTEEGPRLGEDRVIYRAEGGYEPEPQDFRRGDSEVIMAEYAFLPTIPADEWKCVVKGVEVATGRVRTYIDEDRVHNECEGMFPDGEHCCLESSVDMPTGGRFTMKTRDLWKLKLDGTGRRVRMTHFHDRHPWLATNSNVSPDGRWLAFMVNLIEDPPGYGRGLGLLDLEAWGQTPAAQEWETPAGHRDLRTQT